MINIDNKAIFAACLMSSSGAIIYLISPVLIGSAMAHLDLSSDQAGLLIASYFCWKWHGEIKDHHLLVTSI